MPDLIEGRDYVIENGNTVFTARFLTERGRCCDSGCRNCPYSFPNDKKVVSLVPSWTDTLVRCGVTVIGRTRYCVHPAEQIRNIPEVGGTKQCDCAIVDELDPDLVILDKEENAKSMPASLTPATLVTHVKDIPSMISGMININRVVRNRNLNRLINEASVLQPMRPNSLTIEQLPGVLRWVKRPAKDIRTVVYLIWRGPWMAVSSHTFIGSVLSFLGYGPLLPDFEKAYPIVSLKDFDRETTLFLFSSEPYPFAKMEASIRALGLNAAIVDGERYGWFGLKTIEFLKNTRNTVSRNRRDFLMEASQA